MTKPSLLDNSEDTLARLEFETITVDLDRVDSISYRVHPSNGAAPTGYTAKVMERDVRLMEVGRIVRLVLYEVTAEEYCRMRAHRLQFSVPSQAGINYMPESKPRKPRAPKPASIYQMVIMDD